MESLQCMLMLSLDYTTYCVPCALLMLSLDYTTYCAPCALLMLSLDYTTYCAPCALLMLSLDYTTYCAPCALRSCCPMYVPDLPKTEEVLAVIDSIERSVAAQQSK